MVGQTYYLLCQPCELTVRASVVLHGNHMLMHAKFFSKQSTTEASLLLLLWVRRNLLEEIGPAL